MFHILTVVQHLIFLGQVGCHTFLDHVSSGHVSSDTSLKNKGILFNHKEHLSKPSTSEMSLDFSCHFVEMVYAAADNQTFEASLNFLSRNMQSEIFFTSDSFLDPVHSVTTSQMTTESSLHIPTSFINNFSASLIKSVVDHPSGQNTTTQIFLKLQYKGSIEGALGHSISSSK